MTKISGVFMRQKQVFSAFLLGVALLGGAAHADWKSWLKSAKEAVDKSDTSTATTALSNEQIIQGLKDALSVGTEKAIALLGRPGGYLNDAQVKIPLPDGLKSVAKGLRAIGQDELVDEFETTMNRAAEKAVPETVSIFGDTIRQMSLEDARGILNGGDTAATEYFKNKGSGRLSEAILPIVQEATKQAGVTSSYKDLVGQVGFLGSYVDMDSLDLDKYVTAKALDGLFLKLAEQEQLIRNDPVARTTDILKTVFGSLGK
ncbi:DUF4197 domain-containing protein [Sedimenticola selenatireducens]|uniref:DUF4197 domain-containing protein n=2 Tax=Sedimenticola selenatireducens TaxID=191960 RepID=A0A2N6CS49_9GAMM|nr:DUF4197 domain-containing protein [Sedimenticola selenatireducens]PLX59898.1 MAG: DUF4197 domain-containing protein [Sedimenticola selenatireducens]